MNSIVRVFSNFREFYSEINGATLTGAIDVIIVEQPDGSFMCSPFHVRFGKLGVLRSREKIVDIEINGESVDIHMKLGESGEAFFVEGCLEDDGEVPAHMATSPIPTSSFNEMYESSIITVGKPIDDENLPRPRRNSIDLSKENTESDKSKFENQKSDFSHRRHTDNTTGRPNLSLTKKEYTTQKIRQEWAEAEHEQIFQIEGIDSPASNWQNSTLLPVNNDQETHFKPIEAAPTSTESKQDDQQAPSLEDKTNLDSKSKKKRRKKSIMKKKNSQRKNSSSSSAGSNHSDQNDAVETDSITASQLTASSASGSPKDNVPETQTEVENLKETLEPTTRTHELDIHFFSDTEITTGTSPRQSRPSTPVQSDTEFEFSQRENIEGDNMSASWKWGELPTKPEENEDLSTSQGKQQHYSMINSLMSFMKQNNKKLRKNVPDGLYLSDLDESLDPEVAALYFPPVSSKAKQAQTEEDRESGNGTSLPHSPTSLEGIKSLDSDFDDNKDKPHSPTSLEGIKNLDSDFDDNKDKLSLEIIELSLCGGLENNGTPSYEEFEKHRLHYTDVYNNPAVFASRKLVVRLNDKYCTWVSACIQIMTMLAFRKTLPRQLSHTSNPKSLDAAAEGSGAIDTQSNKQQVQQASEVNSGGRWWYWRRSNDKATMKTDNEPEQQSKTSAIATQTSRSNTPEDVGTMTESLSKTKEDGYNGSQSSEDSELPTDQSLRHEIGLNKSDSFVEKYRKTLRLSSEQIESLNLNDGMNEIVFSVTTAYQGTTRCKCYLFKWKYSDKVVISDIDGTITKSDVLGHILPMVGKNWEQIGVAQLFSKIEENGYKMLYLSARAIGQAKTTRDYLQSIRQGDVKLPDGPLLLNPTSLMSAFHREVIEKKPEQFKIACLSDIQALFPDKNPFYAGYGNRINDVWAYRAVGIPISRIFTINTKGELKHELTQTFQSTYAGQSLVVNDIFPPIICELSSGSEHSDYGQSDDEADSCFEEGDYDCTYPKQRCISKKSKFRRRSSGHCNDCDQVELQFRYANMAYIVDQLFPPIKHIEEEDSEFTSFNYWRDPLPDIELSFDLSSSPPSGSGSSTPVTLLSGKVTPTSTLVQQVLPTIPEN